MKSSKKRDDVSIGVGQIGDFYGVYISRTNEDGEQEIFDGEKWYAKTERFETMPVVFTLDPKGIQYLQACLDGCKL